MRTIYSLYFPETRNIVHALWKSLPHEMYEEAWKGGPDNMHIEFLQTWNEWSGMRLGKEFPHAYPANGASEVINNLIIPPGRVHIIRGEYEGYAKIAEARSMAVVTHETLDNALFWRGYAQGDMFWISNPASIDGEFIEDFENWLEMMSEVYPNLPVYLDVTYIGVVKNAGTRGGTPIVGMKLPQNVRALIFSLSKPFGTYYHRIGGVFSRTPILSMEGNIWFKNLFSLRLGTELMRAFGVTELPQRYSEKQRKLVALLKTLKQLPEDAESSNAVLFARSKTGPLEYMRAPRHYRYCLTPGLSAMIRGDEREERSHARA